jgi:hypothetical protein
MKRIALFLILGAALFSCAKKEQPKPAAEPTPVPVKPAVIATVSFVKGDVQKLADGAWNPAVLGDSLIAEDSLNLAAKAELELTALDGKKAKIAGPKKETARILLETAPVPAIQSKALKSIKKIEGTKQTLEEQTPTAVAGIRGAGKRIPVPDTTVKADTAKKPADRQD